MDKVKNPVVFDAWRRLRDFTPARIALGHSGVSLPSRPHLDFQLAHAQARDAVHLALDVDAVERQLQRLDVTTLRLHSAASDRRVYLQRPDLGRRLEDASRQHLKQWMTQAAAPSYDVAFVVADGLSALAIHRHGAAFLQSMLPKLQGWRISPVALVTQGRVAIGDEIGQLLHAQLVVVLIGERPGLSAPDSLGLYLSYGPRIGLTDAERNCISNVRPEGLRYEAAADKLLYLLTEARQRQLSGVNLKDEEQPVIPNPGSRKNFLVNIEDSDATAKNETVSVDDPLP